MGSSGLVEDRNSGWNMIYGGRSYDFQCNYWYRSPNQHQSYLDSIVPGVEEIDTSDVGQDGIG